MRVSWFGSFPLGVLLLGLMALLIGCGDEAGGPTIRHPQDFLPQVLGGMTPEGSPTNATTAEELSDAINGGFNIYVEHNFQECTQQFYQGTIRDDQVVIEVWVFEMPTTQDATDLQNDEQLICTAFREVLSDIGDQGELCYTGEWQMIRFRRENYYSRIFIETYPQEAFEDVRTVLELFATHIDQKITE